MNEIEWLRKRLLAGLQGRSVSCIHAGDGQPGAQVVRREQYHQIVSRVLLVDTVSSRIPPGVLAGTLRGRARISGRCACVFCIRLISHTRAPTTHALHSHRPIRTAATRRSRMHRPRRSRRPHPDRPLPLRLAPTTTAVAAAAAALHTPRAHTHTRTHAAQRSYG